MTFRTLTPEREALDRTAILKFEKGGVLHP